MTEKKKITFSQATEISRINLPNSANRDWRAKCNVRRLANLPVFNTTSSWPTSHKSNPVQTARNEYSEYMTVFKIDLSSPERQEDA